MWRHKDSINPRNPFRIGGGATILLYYPTFPDILEGPESTLLVPDNRHSPMPRHYISVENV